MDSSDSENENIENVVLPKPEQTPKPKRKWTMTEARKAYLMSDEHKEKMRAASLKANKTKAEKKLIRDAEKIKKGEEFKEKLETARKVVAKAKPPKVEVEDLGSAIPDAPTAAPTKPSKDKFYYKAKYAQKLADMERKLVEKKQKYKARQNELETMLLQKSGEKPAKIVLNTPSQESEALIKRILLQNQGIF